jgi:hypothetical protein
VKFIHGLLSEDGTISTTRFVQINGLFMAFIIAIIGIEKNIDISALSILCLSFMVPQTIAKVMQKRIEGSMNETQIKTDDK